MKICLVNPPYIKKHYSTEMIGVPLPCLAYLAASLSDTEHEIELIDAKLEGLTIKKTLNRIQQIKPDILGLSVVTTDMPVARKIAGSIKKDNEKIKIIVGGVHPSALPKETLEKENNFDVIVIGEGEAVFPELVNCIYQNNDLANIDGIGFRTNNNIRINSPIKFQNDLDDYPIPLWNKLPKGRMYYIQITRGCPGSCSFCYRMFGKELRVSSVERIIQEINMILNYAEPEEFFFSAATFGLPKKHSINLMEALISSGLNKKIKWRAATRPDIHDINFFKLMKKAGCYSVGFGIESGDNDILKISNKKTRLERIKKSMDDAKKAGLETVGFFIIGHPYETKQSALKTSDFAVELNPSLVTIGIMTPWPGTQVYEMALKGEGGYILSSPDDIEGQNKHFGKRAMHFKEMKMTYIQWLRIKTYFLLYYKNQRYVDGLRFVLHYFRDGIALLFDIIRQSLRVQPNK